jgi:electron transport protein HydN
VQNSFVIADPNKCIGCRTCMAACAIEHSGEDFFHTDIENINFNPRLNVVKMAEVSAPVQCRQCDDSPCATVCPVKAIENENGCVYINKNLCIGCKSCMVVCPYGAIELIDQYNDNQKIFQQNLKTVKNSGNVVDLKWKTVADKCDLCVDREEGPVCIEVCPTKALKLVTYEDEKKCV